MTLKSMKLDKQEMKEQAEPAADLIDRPCYPYGLSLRLDEDALDKLGISTLPEVDGVLMLTAKVTVTGASSNERSTGGDKTAKHRCLELQITDMALGAAPAEKDAADELYSKA